MTTNVLFVLTKESEVFMRPEAALRGTTSWLAKSAPDAGTKMGGHPPANDPPNTGQASTNQIKALKTSQGTIWVKDGEFVRPVEVKLGTSDGLNTAVVAAELREGQVVVTGEIVATAQTDAKNPFLPVMR